MLPYTWRKKEKIKTIVFFRTKGAVTFWGEITRRLPPLAAQSFCTQVFLKVYSLFPSTTEDSKKPHIFTGPQKDLVYKKRRLSDISQTLAKHCQFKFAF